MSGWFNRLISKKKPKSAAVLGVSLGPHGAAWCVLEPGAAGRNLTQSATVVGSFKSPLEGLDALQRESPLPSLPCHISLSHHFYNILLVDTPDVPDLELREAVKWRVKDLISQPVDKMVVDVFRLPADAYRGRMNMLYAALIEKPQVLALIQACERMQVPLTSIGIAELAITAIAKMLPDVENRGLALVYLTGEDGSINLVENGYLYLTRTLEMNAVGGYTPAPDIGQDPTDSLALDIQRSLDYYESQLGKSGVSRVYLVTESLEQQMWCEGLSQRLPVKAIPLQLAELVNLSTELNTLQQGLLAPAVGVALGAGRA